MRESLSESKEEDWGWSLEEHFRLEARGGAQGRRGDAGEKAVCGRGIPVRH